MASGKIYVIQSGESNYYKIGLTRNFPKSRLATLQTGNPYRLFLRKIINVVDMRIAEDILHRRYYQQRGIGEWFLFDPKHYLHPARISEAIVYMTDQLQKEVEFRLTLKDNT